MPIVEKQENAVLEDSWENGIAYEQFMGRWSKLVSEAFITWLEAPTGLRWADVGCGTGNLTKSVLQSCQPEKILSLDSSPAFIAYAKKSLVDLKVDYSVCYAQALGLKTKSIDALVSGLMINFIPEPLMAINEMIRVTKRGGIIGGFVWDYADGMQFLRYFWDAASVVASNAVDYDEGSRFPICKKGQLEKMFRLAGMKQIEGTAIEIKTEFKDFNDYWQPFLGHVGAAPVYLNRLSEIDRHKLRDVLQNSLPINQNGSISLSARAWAVKGIV